jgi:radical SAM superfamily enzyme YgiQ (UPF0313 family)
MLDNKKVFLLVPPTPPHIGSTQTDAVLSRCAGVYAKTDYFITPIGLTYIASYLREMGFKVKLYDFAVQRCSRDTALEMLCRDDYWTIIASPSTVTLQHDINFVKDAKERTSCEYTIGCGTHLTTHPEDGLNEEGLDFIIMGEPEKTIGELLITLAKSEDYNNIKSIAFREKGKIITNPRRPLIEDIDSLPFPARDLIKDNDYQPPFAGGGKFTVIITSRGCPYPCTYCATRSYYGKSVRMRSVGNILAEIEEIKKDYDVLGFWDDTFNINREQVINLCKGMVEDKMTIPFICMARVKPIDSEMLYWMKNAGCFLILYGVEAGTDRILKKLKKQITLDDIRNTFRLTNEAGIGSAGFFMVGTPGETEKEIITSINLAHELKPDYISFNITTPFPGTELYEEMRTSINGWSTYDARHSLDDKTDVLAQYINKAYTSFYLKPETIFRRLHSLKNWEDWSVLFNAGFDVMREYFGS